MRSPFSQLSSELKVLDTAIEKASQPAAPTQQEKPPEPKEEKGGKGKDAKKDKAKVGLPSDCIWHSELRCDPQYCMHHTYLLSSLPCPSQSPAGKKGKASPAKGKGKGAAVPEPTPATPGKLSIQICTHTIALDFTLVHALLFLSLWHKAWEG